jgi:hypothetical protein
MNDTDIQQTKQLLLEKIRLDGDTQPRCKIDYSLVSDYAELFETGIIFPPIVIFYDGVDHWLADGFHRWHAARKADKEHIDCEVRQGSQEDARWYSYSVNQAHGLRRSNEDKRKVVQAALIYPKGAKMSDVQIAEHCGVSQPFVGKIREELSATYNDYKSPERTGRDGRTINTANIGRGKRESTIKYRNDNEVAELLDVSADSIDKASNLLSTEPDDFALLWARFWSEIERVKKFAELKGLDVRMGFYDRDIEFHNKDEHIPQYMHWDPITREAYISGTIVKNIATVDAAIALAIEVCRKPGIVGMEVSEPAVGDGEGNGE